MIILGAGMAGLLAGNMLRRFEPTIYEAQPSLPNNHAALLRFRTDAVSIATSIPFKKVKVQKAVWYNGQLHDRATLAMQNMYSFKVTGGYFQRSIGNLEAVDRFIAPENFIEQAAKNLDIRFDTKVKFIGDIISLPATPIISTIPMNIMMDIAGWNDKPEFKYLPIWSITADIDVNCNLYQTIYFPEDIKPYRLSITGNKVIFESTTEIVERAVFDIFDCFGIKSELKNVKVKHQKYGKLLPIDEHVRKRFILWLTEKYGIYSLGRFATWRQILLDDVVNDVNVIESLIQHNDSYDRSKRSAA